MAWYRAGTVAVTNGNTTVTGTGTAFAANVRVGDDFIGPDGANYEVVNVASDLVISISPGYKGTAASGQGYAIMPVQGYQKGLADQVRLLVDAAGPIVGNPNLADLAALPSVDNLTALEGLAGAADRLPYFTGAGAMDVAPFTDAGRDLAGAADVAAQQTALGLVPQTSPSDATAGRVLLTGAHGRNGGPAIAAAAGNLNSLMTSGAFIVDPNSVSVSNSPDNTIGWLVDVQTFVRSSETQVRQVAVSLTDFTVWSRGYIGGAWGGWDLKIRNGSGWVTADLNTLRIPGITAINGASANTPNASWGLLTVTSNLLTGSDLFIHQQFVATGSTLVVYERTYNAGAWGAWVRTWYDSGRQVPTYVNGYLDSGFRYSRVNTTIYLDGIIGRTPNGAGWTPGQLIFTLPEGFRPNEFVNSVCWVHFLDTNSHQIMQLNVNTDGQVASGNVVTILGSTFTGASNITVAMAIRGA